MSKLNTSRADILARVQTAKETELQKHSQLLSEQEQRLQSELNSVLNITSQFTEQLKSQSSLAKKLFLAKSWTVGLTAALILTLVLALGLVFWLTTGKLSSLQSEITRLNMSKASLSATERLIAEGKIEMVTQDGKIYLINKNPRAKQLWSEKKYQAWEF